MKNVVLITGGASGLGKEIAQAFLRRGCVVYSASRTKEVSAEENLRYVKMDITSDTDIESAIKYIFDQEGQIDVVVNNAGVTFSGPTLRFSTEEFRTILDINVVGSFRLLKAIFHFEKKPRLVVNITSLNGFFSFPNFGIYCASKFAAEALGLALRYELGATTQVVNVAPGALLAESKKPLTHASARERIKLLGWLLPLTSMPMVAEKVVSLMNRNKVPNQILIGRDACLIYFMQKLLPRSVLDRIIFFIWKKQQ